MAVDPPSQRGGSGNLAKQIMAGMWGGGGAESDTEGGGRVGDRVSLQILKILKVTFFRDPTAAILALKMHTVSRMCS
jgi:hypothetical protein